MASVGQLISPLAFVDTVHPTLAPAIKDITSSFERPVLSIVDSGVAVTQIDRKLTDHIQLGVGAVMLKDSFLKNYFGLPLKDIRFVVYPYDDPVVTYTYDDDDPSVLLESTATFPAYMFISFGNENILDIYKNLVPRYTYPSGSEKFFGDSYISSGNILGYYKTPFPYSLVKSLYNQYSGSNVVAVFEVNLKITLNPSDSITTSSSNIYRLTYAVYTDNDVVIDNDVFYIDLLGGTFLLDETYVGLISVDPTISDIDISYIPHDILLMLPPLSISNGSHVEISSGFPFVGGYQFHAPDYEYLWMGVLDSTVYDLDSDSFSSIDWETPNTFISSSSLPEHPIESAIVSLTSTERSQVENTNALFLSIPEVKFPDSASFNSFHVNLLSSISSVIVDLDLIYIPEVWIDKNTSTVEEWLTLSNAIKPITSEAQARTILYGPMLMGGDGSLRSPARDALRAYVSYFGSTPHLPPAGSPRGVVGNVVTTYPYMTEYTYGTEEFLTAHINPVLRLYPGGPFAIMGNYTLYSDESSYKSRVDSMVLTRIVKKIIKREFSKIVFNEPNLLASVAENVASAVSSLGGVSSFTVTKVQYDPASRTGYVEFELLLTGVVEKIYVTVNIGSGGVQVQI